MEKNRVTAGIFAILLGGIGVHNFYLGRFWRGVLDVLFCWTGIPQVIGIIYGILWLTMSDDEFIKSY